MTERDQAGRELAAARETAAAKQVALSDRQRFVRRFGWKPDLPDPRDLRIRAPLVHASELPARTTNYAGNAWLPRYDQGDLGSCGPNAVVRAHRIVIRRTIGGLHDFDGSRLAHYYWTRELAGDPPDADTGVYIRDCVKVLNVVGVAPEAMWRYDVARFADRPTDAVLAKAASRLRVTYHRVDQVAAVVKSVLYKRRPVVFGTSVFPSTSDALAGDGIVPMPGAREPVIGGHAMLIEDYDDVSFAEPVFLAANSWGEGVGLGIDPAKLPSAYRGHEASLVGYAAIPQRMLLDQNYADDFWALDAAA